MNGFHLTPGIKKILIANVAVFFLQMMIPNFMVYYFGLYGPTLVGNFFVWTPVTYMFLHGGFGHIFFNMFALWVFGTELEDLYGTGRFYALYFLGGLIGGLAHLLISPNIMTIGASAGVMSLVVAYGFIFPDRLIYLNFLIPVKAKWLAIGYVVLDLMGAFGAGGAGIAHLAHLGGAAVGFYFAKSRDKMTGIANWFAGFGNIIKVQKKGGAARKKTSPFKNVTFGSSEDEKYEYYQKKVDEILDKINRVGYLNLSDDERDLLDQGSRFIREYNRKHGN